MQILRLVRLALLSCAAASLFPTPVRAGDYDNDCKDAIRLLDKKAGDTGMAESDRQKFDDLLGKYSDERGKLMEQMVNVVSKTDITEQKDAWVELANKGRDLLDRLDKDVPKTNGNDGLAAAGLSDFVTGEKRIWDAVSKGNIALSAEIMNKISRADQGVLKKCDEDLKTCRDGDRAIQAQLEQCENEISQAIKGEVKVFATKMGEKVLTGWLKEGSAKDYAKETYKTLLKMFESNLKSAKDKRLLKEILLQDIKLISDAKEKLGESAINDEYKSVEDACKNLPGVGSTGDYKAADWDRFQQNCIKGIAEAKNAATEQTKKVYNDLLPVFVDENQKKFATIQDDPGKLDDWQKSVEEDFKSMDELLDKEDEYVKDLAKGDYRTAVEETMKDIREHVKNCRQAQLEASKADDEEMKK